MMKFSLFLSLILVAAQAVVGFQSSRPVVASASSTVHQPSLPSNNKNYYVATAKERLPQQQHSNHPQPPLFVSSISMDSSATATSSSSSADADAFFSNPWTRVCTTVSTTTSQLNALRQKIAKSGVATAISYSLVSNVFSSVAVGLAWYGFSMQTGLSPLCPGQWKPFLAWYAGFYAVNSLLKPLRFVLALGVVPHTERLMNTLQQQVFADSRRATIASTTAILLATSGCIMASGIFAASVLSNTPIFMAAAGQMML